GAILYAILTLRHPVTGKNLMDVLEKVARGDIAPPTIYNRMTAEPAKADAGEVASAKKFAGLPHCPDGQVPESLSAVTMRAMARKPEKRYPSVGQLIGDIEAYQDGFATSAENAGLFTQLRLLVRRHKAISALGVLMLALTAGFVAKVFASERKATAFATEARQRLAELRGTAPIFRAQAQVDFEAGNRDDALQKLGYAIQLDDSVADFHLFRAHLRQSSFQLSEAADGYRRVLELKPEEPSAKENLALCVKLLAADASPTPQQAHKLELLAALKRQKRLLEVASLSADIAPDMSAGRAAIIARLRAMKQLPGWRDDRVTARPDGTYSLNWSSLPQIDFSILKGLRVSRLDLVTSSVTNVTSLAGVDLRELRLDARNLTDFTDLKGLPLEVLDFALPNAASFSKQGPVRQLSDLRPLRGMKLRELNLSLTKVKDLTPLAGMPLQRLNLSRTQVEDLSPLATCTALKWLHLQSTTVHDLTPLANKPLEWLGCDSRGITSIAPLAGLPLKELHLPRTRVADLTPLASCRQLSELHMDGAPVTDLTPLTGLPLTKLIMNGTKITDLTPLRGSPLTGVALASTGVTNLAPLAECKALEWILLPRLASDPTPLRRLPKLNVISYTSTGGGGNTPHIENHPRASQRAADFWREFDAGKAAAPK
ncbi:MAG: hypothetical protein B9S33_09995, partial [Pedosphaera sp. Tous-C6FEB]